MSEQITVDGVAGERAVRYNQDADDTYVDIEISGKEAVDVINALEHLLNMVETGQFQTDLPIRGTLNLARGGIHFPNDCNVMVTSNAEARVLLHALLKYDPEEVDLTGQLQEDVLRTMEKVPIAFDTAGLEKLVAGHR